MSSFDLGRLIARTGVFAILAMAILAGIGMLLGTEPPEGVPLQKRYLEGYSMYNKRGEYVRVPERWDIQWQFEHVARPKWLKATEEEWLATNAPEVVLERE